MAFWNDVWISLVQLFGGQVWLLMLVTVLTVTAIVDILQRKVLKTLNLQLIKHRKIWLESFVSAIRPPISFFIWVTGTVLALNTLILRFDVNTDIIPMINSFKSTVLTLAVGWFAIRWVSRLERHIKQLAKTDDRFDEVTVEAMAKILKLFAFVLTGLIFLNAFGVSLTGLLAFGGMGGIAVGFAAKDILGNVLGGLMIYMDKPFTVGDWIRSPDQQIEGTVENIGWRITTVRTFDQRPLYIPNGIFANISIENPSRMKNRRIFEHIGIRYADINKIKAITSDITQMLRAHEEIDQEQTMIVNFNAFSSSSVDIMVYTFTKTIVWTEFHQVKQDVLLKIYEIVDTHGAEIAFPTQTLHIDTQDTPIQFSGLSVSEPVVK